LMGPESVPKFKSGYLLVEKVSAKWVLHRYEL